MEEGYEIKPYPTEARRYCRMLTLRSPELAALYRERHAAVWPEISVGIRQVGIYEMEIYLLGTTAFMILDVPATLDLEEAMARLATLPRQQEWEDYMSVFQQASEGMTSAQKWQPLERVYHLPEISENL